MALCFGHVLVYGNMMVAKVMNVLKYACGHSTLLLGVG
jgi:hypothetical protein